MSSYWLPVLTAFGWGMAAAYALEALWRLRARRKRPWPFLCLALTCAGLAMALGNFELGIRNYEGGEVPHFVSHLTEPSVPGTLSVPVIRNYELGIRNYEGGEATPGASPITDFASPITTSPTRLSIPRLDINRPVVAVPLVDGVWDVADLGGDVGLLATTGQHPGDDLAMVLAGHMTFADGRLLFTGAFAELQYATYGTEIVVEMGAETAVYQVSEIRRLAPDDVDDLYLADGDSILLITCTDWNDSTGLYANRLLVRATRIKSGSLGIQGVDRQ
ncbi:MAG: class F sortase [Anaerolineae bacterium]|nr:class F sortase [Anaerolineae bacterium]